MKELIAIGQVTSACGIKGEVRVYPLTDFPERFKTTDTVFVCREDEDFYELYRIENARFHKGMVIIQFAQCTTRQDAEALRGAYLKVEQEKLVKLPPGHYYIHDIIGLDVYDISGSFIGVVRDVLKTGSNDVYVVQRSEGEDILVPAIKEIVREIYVEKGQMVIERREGLF
jgi:16S rRNA processing protein RimM